MGIDARYHEKLFELLQRLDPQAYDATGIGLTLVKRIVELRAVYLGRVRRTKAGQYLLSYTAHQVEDLADQLRKAARLTDALIQQAWRVKQMERR